MGSAVTAPTSRPLRVFISYSHHDDEWRVKLVTALTQLQHDRLIERWDDREITAGVDWAGKIDEHLNAADLILLLVSPDFIASPYCYDREMRRALERSDNHEARVVPIILRPCDWKTSPFARLNALPKDGKPVVDWRTPDHAFLDIAEGLRRIAREATAPTETVPTESAGSTFIPRQPRRKLALFGVAALILLGLVVWFWRGQVNAYLAEGNDLLNVGHYEDARGPFESARRIDPANAKAKLGIEIANLVASKGDSVADHQRLNELLARWPNESHLRVLNGDSLLTLGSRREAAIEYNQAIKLNPSLAEAYFRLGIIYDKEGRLAHSLELYQKAVNLSPLSAHYRNNLADAKFKHGEYESAIAEYGRIDRFPLAALESANIYRLLGRLAEAREQEVTAVKWLADKSIAGSPENQLPWYFTHEAQGITVAGADQKMCYAKFEVSATSYLRNDEGQAAKNAEQAQRACGSRSLDVKAVMQWDLKRVADERDELRARAEAYTQKFLDNR